VDEVTIGAYPLLSRANWTDAGAHAKRGRGHGDGADPWRRLRWLDRRLRSRGEQAGA
jgi:hypothetical protein